MKNLLASLTFATLANVAVADTKPFNLSLTPDIALQNRADSIHGVTLSIWGENQQKSLALGIVNGSNGDSGGLSIGLLNYAKNSTGVQWGLVNSVSGNFKGWQDGWVNSVSGDFTGWQDGLFNYTGGEMHGLQSGWFNCAGKLRGVQFGLVNYAKTVSDGVQVGLLNLIPQNAAWFTDLPDSVAPGMLFVNWRF
jgi:hypothetical protein